MAQFYSAKRCVTTRQIIRVMIDELDGLGQGVGRINGKALFISGALPGECVEVEIVQEKSSWARGKTTRILSASSERVAPRCPYFGRCGGCQIQHASSTLQQQSKANALSRMLSQKNGVPVVNADHLRIG